MPGKNNGRIFLNVTFLKYLRTKRGLTQDNLAQDCRTNRLAISISSIKRAESGQKVLYRTALNFARYYGVDIADIMCDSEVRPVLTKSPSQRSLDTRALHNEISKNQNRMINTESNRYFIVLLVESKMASKDELKNFLRYLNISFIADYSHITVSVSQEDCNIEIFRYFKHLTRLLLTRFCKRIRICAHMVCMSSFAEQKSSMQKKVQVFPDSILQTMQQILKLTAWDAISACSCIVSSGACTPLNSAKALSVVAEGWSNVSVSQPYIQFVGRHWELSQLCNCYRSATQSRQGITVYLDGIEGIGKTALIHRFIESINMDPSSIVLLDLCHLSVARQPALQYLTRQLLDLPSQANDAITRGKIDSLAISLTLQVFICLMAGVALLNTESSLLKAMTNEHREAAVSDALTKLIDMRTTDGQLLLIIEDMYLADANFTEVIKLFSRLTQNRPFLLCITARKNGKYSHRPAWLEHACIIELTSLTHSQSMAIVSTVSPTNTSRECVSRAFGHPGYLLQMLNANEYIRDFKVVMDIATAFKLNNLNTTDVMALKIAAVFEKPLSLEHWRGIVIPLLGNLNAIHIPQTLVYAGLLKHVSDSYTFHHPAIRESIMDSITKEEYRKIEQAIQQWKIKWDLADEQVGLSPAHSDIAITLVTAITQNSSYFQ